MQYLSDYQGLMYHYRSTLRPVASIGWNRIPNLLMEPGSDPNGTRRDFYTSETISSDIVDQFSLELLGTSKNP
jgi:hypothetical protein